MSDFLYTNKRMTTGFLTDKIKKIYHEDYPKVQEFHGNWGSIAISENLYNGFQPYETDKYIFAVIGGPVLYFQDNYFLKTNDSNIGTKAIFDRWKANNINWDEDLSGPFAIIIINKVSSKVSFVTDLMSFIPIYIYQDLSNFMLSTHVDVLAEASNQNEDFDIISCADFVLNGIITYPYTLYKKINQVRPGTIHYISQESNQLESNSYWLPQEKDEYSSISEAATDLKQGMLNFTNRVTSEVSKIAQFISGGEDSRVLSALLNEYPRSAYVFLDQMNREGRMAKEAAQIYNANFNIATRSKTHYIDILPDCSDLLGSGSQYHHAHTFDFHKRCKLDQYYAVFGGLFSDALLKGARIKKLRISNKLPLIGDIKDNSYSPENYEENPIFTKSILKEVSNRRRAHLNELKIYRPDSAEEWFELWPSSMNMNIPNIHANRRLFRSYEPFMANNIVKLSARTPQKWKLNRKLFLKTFKKDLKPSKWMFHTDGRLPYLPWYINTFIQSFYRIYEKIGVKTGFIKGNQGPWAEWGKLLNSIEWETTMLKNLEGSKKISTALIEKDIEKVFKNNNIFYLQKINLMQLLYQLNKE